MRKVLHCVAIVAGLVASTWLSTARADTWMPPERSTVESPKKTARVTVTPRGIAGPLAYFSDKVDGKDKAGQARDAPRQAIAQVEVRAADGTWRTLWQGPLVNDVAPVDFLVSDDGSRLVTFDNWHSMGHGDDVLVVYDATGKVLRQWSLADLLTPAYVPHVMRSVSSIWWRQGDPALVDDGATLRIDVAAPGNDDSPHDGPTVPLLIDLATAERLPTLEWETTMLHVRWLEAGRQVAWQAYRAERALPLAPPATTGFAEWRKYMEDVRERLRFVADESVGGSILPLAGQSGRTGDDAERITSMLDEYVEWEERWGGRFVFVSADADALADLLVRHFSQAKAGAYAGVTVAINGSEANVARVAQAAKAAGAQVTRVADPMPGIALEETAPDWFQPRPEE